MTKKTQVKLKGILDSLEDGAEEPQDTKQMDTTTNTDKIDKKKNRSFMLTDASIKQLKELNFILDKDLSTIVNNAIDMYYEAHKQDIQNTLK